MRTSPAVRAVVAVWALLAAAAAAPLSDLTRHALTLLESESEAAGRLALDATLWLLEDEGSRPDLVPAILELRLAASQAAGSRLELVVALAAFDLEPRTIVTSEQLPAAPAGDELSIRLRLEVPEEIDRAVVAAALAGGEPWGAVVAELAMASAEGLEATAATIQRDLRPADPAAAAAPVAVPLRLLPPTAEPVTGRTRIRVLISDPAVDRVHFELDGEAVADDGSPPFAAVIDFGAEPAPRELRAVGLDAAGRPLGEDRLVVNQPPGGRRIRIDELRAETAVVAVGARLEIGAAAPPERVDFYLNESLVKSLRQPPWRAELPRPEPAASDFVRAVAVFSDGSSVEDARLVETAAERVEVNLVQLFAVVTDRDGTPRSDLTADDFEVRLAGRRQPLERFALGQEVPLVLGLVIDTSGSMWTLMPDTRKAGSSFLVRTLRPGDRAFLVDFDTRPRLAAALTDDLGALLARFAGLTAEGFTALYDAVIFSMLQFQRSGGRKALVVLTDGDDYKSRFGARRCIEYGRELGVPVYIIALGGFFGERRDLRKLDLESLAGSTGGRVFYIGGSDELAAAYDRIQEELRSQYLLAFATPHPLTADELARIEVVARPRGLRVRAVAGLNQP